MTDVEQSQQSQQSQEQDQVQWRYIAYYQMRNGSATRPLEGALRGVVTVAGGATPDVMAAIEVEAAHQLGVGSVALVRARVEFNKVTITRVRPRAQERETRVREGHGHGHGHAQSQGEPSGRNGTGRSTAGTIGSSTGLRERDRAPAA